MGDLLEFKRPNQSASQITILIKQNQEQFNQTNEYVYKPSLSGKIKEKCLDGICFVLFLFLPKPNIEEMLFPEDYDEPMVSGK